MSRQAFGAIGKGCAIATVILGLSGSAVRADVIISTKATSNMSCGGGFCTPTASKAVLNATDLENNLTEFGNVTVTTTGGKVEAHNIVVEARFASPGGSFLNLMAHDTIRVDDHVTIGTGGQISGLELVSHAGGLLGAISFGAGGRFSFDSTSDQFNINGGVAQLVDSLPSLASAIAANNGGGFFVLTDNYNARKDGTYHSSPVPTAFTGIFDALGNHISNLRIKDTNALATGLFATVDGSQGFGVIRNLGIENASVKGGFVDSVGAIAGDLVNGALLQQSFATGEVMAGGDAPGGGLVGDAEGVIDSCWSSVNVTGGSEDTVIGGLAGYSGTITNSYATGRVTAGKMVGAGGLIGENEGSISGSFATGDVQIKGTLASDAGGLVGVSSGSVDNSYATGNVHDTGGGGSVVGGLIGITSVGGTTTSSYSTGAPVGVDTDDIGGTVGADASGPGSFKHVYWDISTSHVSQGAGNKTKVHGVSGLTSKALRSGLPQGFKPSVWTEQSGVNQGFPWLIANPPVTNPAKCVMGPAHPPLCPGDAMMQRSVGR